MSTTNETLAGLRLHCPYCGEDAASIALMLRDLTFQCAECDTEFSRDEVRKMVDGWAKVLRWVDTFPSPWGE